MRVRTWTSLIVLAISLALPQFAAAQRGGGGHGKGGGHAGSEAERGGHASGGSHSGGSNRSGGGHRLLKAGVHQLKEGSRLLKVEAKRNRRPEQTPPRNAAHK